MTHLISVDSGQFERWRLRGSHRGVVEHRGGGLDLARLVPLGHGVVSDHIHPVCVAGVQALNGTLVGAWLDVPAVLDPPHLLALLNQVTLEAGEKTQWIPPQL